VSLGLQDLSCVIPVSNYYLNGSNLKALIEATSEYNLEIILSCDSLTEGELKELNDVIDSKPRVGSIQLIAGDFGNPGEPRNRGLKLATRNYLVFWDCDDMPNIEGIKSALGSLKNESNDFIMGSFAILNREESEKVELLKTNSEVALDILKRELIRNPGIWRILFKRDFIQNLTFPRINCGEDQVFIEKVLALGPRFEAKSELFYFYRKGNTGSTSNLSSSRKDLSAAILEGEILLKQKMIFNYEIITSMVLKQYFSLLKFSKLRVKLRHSIKLIVFISTKPILTTKLAIKILRGSVGL
jgi:glycosyltransferase involved in cell wall biosynthesis